MSSAIYGGTGATPSALLHDGAQVVQWTAEGINQGAGVAGSFKKLQASSTGLSALVTVTADLLVAQNTAGLPVVLRSVSVTPSTASSGANGLDTGTIAISTWYSVWVIWNGTTQAGLLSMSATAPTMPSGYTFAARVGWIRTDGTANKYPLGFKQYGRTTRYVVGAGTNVTSLPNMASGAAGSPTVPTWVAVGWSAFAPSTIARINLMGAISAAGASGVTLILAPNNSYGAAGSTSNPPFAAITQSYGTGTGQGLVDISIEGSSVYWAGSGTTNNLYCTGWEDNL